MPSLRRTSATASGPLAALDSQATSQSDSNKYKKKKTPVPTRAATYRIEITTETGGSEIEELTASTEGLERNASVSIGVKPEPT